ASGRRRTDLGWSAASLAASRNRSCCPGLGEPRRSGCLQRRAGERRLVPAGCQGLTSQRSSQGMVRSGTKKAQTVAFYEDQIEKLISECAQVTVRAITSLSPVYARETRLLVLVAAENGDRVHRLTSS